MADYDAGKIEASLDLDKDPFLAGLEEAKAAADDFAADDAVATLDADSEPFDEKVDDAKAKADELGDTDTTVTVGADTTDADAEMDKLRVDLSEVSDRVYDAKVDVDDAEAVAKLDDLKARIVAAEAEFGKLGAGGDLGQLRSDVDDLDADVGKLGRDTDDLGGSLDRTGASADGAGKKLKDAGDKADGAGKKAADSGTGWMDLAKKIAIAFSPASIPIAGVIGAGVAASLPFLAELGAGFGGIALVATPALSQVKTAITNARTAQASYNVAVADGSKSGQAEALAEIKEAFATLSPQARAAATAYESFSGAYSRWASSFQPQIFTMMSAGLSTLQSLLPDLTPLVSNSLWAVSNLGQSIQQYMPDLRQFIGFLATQAPAAITALGNVLSGVAVGFAGFVEAFSPLTNTVEGGFVTMAGEFERWGQGLADNPGFKAFVAYIQTEAPVVRAVFDNIAHGFEDLVRAAAPVGAALLGAFNGIAGGLSAGGTGSALDSIGKSLAGIVTAATPVVKILASDLGGALSTLAGDLQPLLPQIHTLLTDLEPLAKVMGPGFASGFLQVFDTAAPAVLAVATNIATLLDRITKAHPQLITFAAEAAGGAYALSKFAGPVRAAVGGIKSMAGVLPGAVKDLGNFSKLLKGVDGVEAAGGIGKLATALRGIGTGFGANIGKLVNGFKQLLTMLPGVDAAMVGFDAEADANPIGVIALAVVALGAGLYELITHFDAVRRWLAGPWGTAISAAVAVLAPFIGIPMLLIGHWTAVVSFFTGMWRTVSSVFTGGVSAVVGFFTGMWSDVTRVVSAGVSTVVGFFEGLPGRIVRFLQGLPGDLETAAGDAIGMLVVGLLTEAVGIWDFFTSIAPKAVIYLVGLGADLAGVAGSAIGQMASALVSAAAAVWAFFEALPGKVLGFLEALPGMIETVGHDVITGLATGMTDAWGAVTAFVASIPGRIESALADAGSWLVSTGSAVINGLVAGFTAAVGDIGKFLAGIPGDVTSAFADAGSWLVSSGEAVISGFVRGIESAAGSVTSAIESTITSHLPGFVKSALGINSPSRVFMALGSSVPEGFALGMTNGGALVTGAWQALQAKVTGPMTVARYQPSVVSAGGGSLSAPGPSSVQITVQAPVTVQGSADVATVAMLEASQKQQRTRLVDEITAILAGESH